MSDRLSRTSPPPRRWLVLLTTTALLSTLLGVLPPATTADAAEAVVFSNTFKTSTVNGTGTVTKPTSPSGTNQACLTASGNSSTGPLLSCSGTTDASGSGALRLTAASGSQVGAVFGSTGVSTTSGLEVTFKSYQYGGGGADGIGFILAAANPTSPAPPTAVGAGGGSLGYSAQGTISGVANGYLGVGLDVYGNFSSPSWQGSGCTNQTNISASAAGAVVVRGPGNGTTGYCGLTTTYNGTASSQLTLRSSSRAASAVPVQVLVNPTTAAFTGSNNVSVPAGSYRVVATPVGGTAKTLTGTLPVASSTLYPSATWLNANGVPKQLAFGFTGSTGGVSDVHEISDVQVRTFDPDPTVGVSTTAYAASTSAAGDPVTYLARTSVSGAPVTGAITVTHTTPVGVLPLAAYASGFTCGAPSGRTISCTSTASSFAVGSSPPDITVVAIATTSITAATVQTSSSTTATATGATSGSDTVMDAGTLPTAPSGLALSPATGSTSGGNTVTVSGSNITAATALEIGTTAQLQAGTPVTLLPCASGTTSSCFAVSGSTLLAYMPSRSTSGTVSVSVVTRGVAGAASYTYAAKPSTIATPTAGAGNASAVLSWTAPAANGSPITSYLITPYLAGTAQTPITVDPAATTRVVNGLTVGGSYTFTVAAVNAQGTSTASAASAAVVPYAALGAPAITSAKAGDASAVVTWTAPSSTGGSAITGYVVTPYVGAVAQTPQTFTGTATTQTLTGLTPGTAYTFRVAAQNASGTTTLYRINAGGPAVPATDGGPGWSADNATTNPYHDAGSNTAAFSPSATSDGTVPAGTPSTLFDDERWDPGTKGDAAEMLWQLPVTAGASVKVRLYFAERTFTDPAARVFDVSIDGSPLLNNFAPAVGAGGSQVATMREFGVTSDGTVDVAFTHEVENPNISAIEIVQTGRSTTGPASTASASVTPNPLPALTFADPPAGYLGVAYSTQLTATGGTAPFVWSVSAGSLPTGLTLNASSGLLSGTPTVAGSSSFTVKVVDASNQSATRPVTLEVTGAPDAPAQPNAKAGVEQATLTWVAPSSNGATITGYVITPYLGGVAQPAVSVGADATSRVLSGLTAGGSYTFTVAAVNARGTSAPSAASAAVVPYAPLGAPTITAVRAGDSSAVLSWTAPSSTGGSPITGYVVTPYTGSVAQTPQTFTGTATTQTVTGLTPGTAYTFRVAAQNASGATSLFRVNAGGPAVTALDGGLDWAADNTGSSPYYGTGTAATAAGSSAALDATIPAGTPVALFDTQRYDLAGGTSMLWQFPVASGASLKVRLYFANRYTGTSQVGQRVFDVTLDGSTVLSSFDAVAAAGDQTATMREFTLTSDGSVDIGFVTRVENPMISAIDIIQVGQGTTGPTSDASAAVTPNASPTLTFAAPPSGEVGVAYSNALVVTGGTSPFVWSVVSGSLPAGLTLNAATGLLSGTPTAAGSSAFTVQVLDDSGQSATKAVTLVVAAAPVLTFAPPSGEVSVAYSYQPTVTGGTAPYTWRISAGSLPAGLTLSTTTGSISGTPTAATTASVTLAVTTARGASVSRTASIVVAALPTLVFSAPAAGQVAVAYSTTFTATGGTRPLVWSISAGSLPSGLALDTATGVLSGTPTTAGSSSFTVTVTDAYTKSASKAVTLVIATGPVVIATTANVSSTVVGGVVAFTITLTNTGSSTFTGVALTDPLGSPGSVLDDADYQGDLSATSGTAGYADGAVSWSGDLAARATATVTYSVTVRNPSTGNQVLTSTVVSSTSGTNCAGGSTDTRCTASVAVAGLSVVKSADAVTTTPGSVVRFTILVRNTGGAAVTGATLTDQLAGVLDDATYDADGAATAGQVSFASPQLTWTGNLAVGASVTITYSVTVSGATTLGRSLDATVVSPTAGSTCPGSAPAASCRTVVAVLVPALAVTTVAGASTTTPGAAVTYTETLANNGQTAYTGTSVTLALAGALDDATYTSASASSGDVVPDGAARTVVWTGDLAVGASVTVTVTLTARNPASGDRSAAATATSAAAGSTCPPGTSNAACTATVSVLVPALSIAQTTDVSSTTPGGTVRYTVTVSNTGQTAYTGATFTESLAGVLDDATYDGVASASSGAVSYSVPTLSWTGNLAVGATATITYSVKVRSPDPGDLTLASTVASSTPFSTCPAGGADSRCSSTVPVLLPALSVSTTVDQASTTPGGVVRYRVSVSNTGQTTYAGVSLTLGFAGVLDDAAYGNDAAVSTGSLTTRTDGTTTWTLSLAPGQDATATASFVVFDPTPATGADKNLLSSVTSDAAGSTCPTGSTATGCRTAVPVLTPRLTITKTADRAFVVTGGTVGYTVLVKNTGETTYPAAGFTDDLAGVLTDATYALDAEATSGAVSYAGSVLSWTGALAPGATVTVSYSVVVSDPDTGDKRMVNTVASTAERNNCLVGSADTRCTAVVDVLVPGLTLAASADAVTTVPGADVGFTVTVTNSGGTAYTGASVSASFDQVLDDATATGAASATTGTAELSGGALTWTGDLAVGAVATFGARVRVNAASTGDNLLTTVLTSRARGSSCVVGSTDPRCRASVAVARLVLERVPGAPATTTPGSVLDLSVRYTNAGKVPYTQISVDIPRADSSDDLFATSPDVVSSGALSQTSAVTRWTGDIPVGGFVTVTILRTVRDPETGNKVITAPMSSDAPGSSCPTTGGRDPRCAFTTVVLVPGLSITKAASSTSVEPGGVLGYTITVRNSGQTAYAASAGTAAVVSDSLAGVLDDAGYDGDATATSGTVGYGNQTLTWTGDLAVGQSAVISYTVTALSPATGDKTMINGASSTTKGSSCPPGGSSAGCRVATGVLTPELTLVKTADVSNATLGSVVTFTLTATNTGQTSYPAAHLSDSLADVLDTATYDPGATTGNPDYSDETLSWTGALSPGASKTITYSVTINDPATGDLDLDNRVVSSTPGSNCPAVSTDPRCRATVAVTDAVALTLTKTASVASTVDGGVVTFTVRATNASTEALTSVDFSDPLAGVLDDATYNDDATVGSGTLVRAGSTLTWTGTVEAGQTVTLTYSVTVASPAAGDLVLTSTVSSTSPATSNSCLPDSGDPRCTVTVPVARLTIDQQVSAPTATPGSLVSLPVTYTNTGRLAYSGISVTVPRGDSADDLEPIGPDTASSGTLVRTDTAVVWRGDIPVGRSVTLSVVRRVRNPPTGNRVAQATLVSDAPGSNCLPGTTDPRCSYRVAVVVPALTITTTSGSTDAEPGDAVEHTLTIRNSGDTPYVGAVVDDDLVGALDDARYDGGAVASSGSVSFTSPVLTWSGNLAVGATATVSFTLTVLDPPSGDKALVDQVSSSAVGSTCPPGGSSAACRSSLRVLTPVLSISSSASRATAVPGDSVTFSVVATNTGQTTYAPATLTVPLAGLLDDATWTGDVAATVGTAGVDGPTLSWSGTLAPGSAVTITYAVVVRSTPAGDRRLSQTVASAERGSTCPAADACTSSVPVAGLRIVNSVDVSTTQPGRVVHHTGTFTNTGQVPYVGISIADSFVGTLDNATYNGDAFASSGSLAIVVGSGRVVWTGDVAVGQTVVVTASLTVNNPPTGDDRLTTRITTAAPASTCPVGGTDPACATDVTLLRPRLSITKAASTATTTPGASIGYTLTATNTGQTPYVGAVVRDDLASALVSASLTGSPQATTGTVSTDDQGLSWVGDLAIGERVDITYALRVRDPDPGGGSITNAVTSDEIGSSCPTGGAAPACTTLVTVLDPALSVSVSADRTSTTPGSTVGYTVVVQNTGETDYASASVTADLGDVLDDAAYGEDATVTGSGPDPGTVAFAESALTWTGVLARGGTATIAYHVTVADPDAGNRSLVTAVSSPAAGTTCSAASPCLSTVAVLLPGVDVASTASVATATPGQPVTFTTRIRNTGQTAYLGTSVGTDLTGVVDDATFDGVSASTRGTTSYVGAVLTWNGSLAVGDEVLITYTVVVKPAAALSPDRVLRSTVAADLPGSTCRTGSRDPGCTASVPVLVPTLSVTKLADVATTTPGGLVRYTVSIRNAGETSYTDATVSDSLAGLLGEATYGADAVVTGGGTLTYGDATLTWTGSLLPGSTATVTYSIRVKNPYVGDRSLSNSVVSSADGSTCPTPDAEPGCTSVVQVLMPALGVTQTADRSSVVAGGRVTYTVTLANTGETDHQPATFRSSFAAPGLLAFADYADDAQADVGTVAYADETLVWTGQLLRGQTAVVTYSVVTRYPAPAPVNGARLMTSTVTSATAGSTCVTGARARCRTSVSVLEPALSVTKVADTSQVVAGGTVGYTITATNTGEADYPTATLSDDLNPLLANASYEGAATASAGVVGYEGGVVRWSGPLARGATVLVTFRLRVGVETPDTVVLTNRVVSSTVGSTCPAGSADPGCATSTTVAARSITVSDLTPSFTLAGLPGSTVEQDGAVGLTVTTNSAGGYAVTARSTSDSLTGTRYAGTIPIERLSVRGTNPRDYAPVSQTPVTVHTSTGPTSTGGDAISNDYRVEIPDVASDTYTTELEYVVTAQ